MQKGSFFNRDVQMCLCKSAKQYSTAKDNNKYTKTVMRAIIENVNC